MHDVDVSAVRSDVDPLVLKLEANNSQMLSTQFQRLNEFRILLAEVPHVDGVVAAGSQNLSLVDEKHDLQNLAIRIMADFHVDTGTTKNPDFSTFISDSKQMLKKKSTIFVNFRHEIIYENKTVKTITLCSATKS